jgi:hypothetical protein
MPETQTFVSMKMPKKKKKVMEMASTLYDEYPYGLGVTLNKDVLKKLKYQSDDFSVGGKLHFSAIANVNSVSKREGSRSDDDYSQSVELQITDLKVIKMANKKLTRKQAMGNPHKY